jgi:farnesyl diphosphate synthase
MNFSEFHQRKCQQVEEALSRHLPSNETALQQAMHYCVFNGGKRFRPLLVYATAEALQFNDARSLDAIASAIELIHCYSLVHDDLPAMDNDDLRRGKPTCHIVFGEATAILVGDALQSLAFEILCHEVKSASGAVSLMKALTQAIGSKGMAQGQAIDMSPPEVMALDHLMQMHELKTGALIQACIKMTCLLAKPSENTREQLQCYAYHLGLLFQIQDDILDVTQSTEILGKPQASDEQQDKQTFPKFMGLDQAKQQAQAHYLAAINALKAAGLENSFLAAIASYCVEREH